VLVPSAQVLDALVPLAKSLYRRDCPLFWLLSEKQGVFPLPPPLRVLFDRPILPDLWPLVAATEDSERLPIHPGANVEAVSTESYDRTAPAPLPHPHR